MTNKKQYIVPVTEVTAVQIEHLILAGSTKQEESSWDDQLSKKSSLTDWEEATKLPSSKSLWD